MHRCNAILLLTFFSVVCESKVVASNSFPLSFSGAGAGAGAGAGGKGKTSGLKMQGMALGGSGGAGLPKELAVDPGKSVIID